MPSPDLAAEKLLHAIDLSPSASTRGVTVDAVTDRGELVRSGLMAVPPAELGAAAAEWSDAGSLRVRVAANEILPDIVRWDASEPWRVEVTVSRETDGVRTLTGRFVRNGDAMALAEPRIVHENGLLFVGDRVARYEPAGAWLVVMTLRKFATVPMVDGELTELLDQLYALPRPPKILLPDDIPIVEREGTPRPVLSIVQDPGEWTLAPAQLTLAFEYGGVRLAPDANADSIFDRARFTILHRDRKAERAARDRLIDMGARVAIGAESDASVPMTIARMRLPSVILSLVRDGWRIEATGLRYRIPGQPRAVVRSGIDWFDLDLVFDYDDGATASLPDLLEAARNHDTTVKLSDGTVGLIPADWLARLGPALAAGSTLESNETRFTRSQAGLLDALLAAMPTVSVDETFERARERLHTFEGVVAADPSKRFAGTLREYQREGLGWLLFLREFGLGGCLADDMGLGKTVQVLALLDRVYADDKPGRPTLIVVPRSLVFNWEREAHRFAPELRVLDYSGSKRHALQSELDQYDVILTTYGTLRSDIADLAPIEFEYAILDEAQAIKNADTASSKAARLLRARHKLALSGTPIENRLEELWSLFDFINPGMLGSAAAFSRMANISHDVTLDDGDEIAGRELLRRAIRPVILRRTKEQVAPDLPERCEETLYVEMEPAQRAFYLEVLARSRQTVMELLDKQGLDRSRMHVLEALLRLRQAACHPGLVDPARASLPSAKLDALIPTLAEIIEEGHKAVVFSQFTSFLALVRERLEADGLRYEYLDGATRNRQERVDNFQSASGPSLFLVSLKAGGHGLNLTAADYVYLLDPWWNPAVEAQAIDRAHRIGQTRTVIATRLVTKGRIVENVLELQVTKGGLADAVVGGEEVGIRGIGREEIELLLAG
jgi:superfamily II DNA or RNA helicase